MIKRTVAFKRTVAYPLSLGATQAVSTVGLWFRPTLQAPVNYHQWTKFCKLHQLFDRFFLLQVKIPTVQVIETGWNLFLQPCFRAYTVKRVVYQFSDSTEVQKLHLQENLSETIDPKTTSSMSEICPSSSSIPVLWSIMDILEDCSTSRIWEAFGDLGPHFKIMLLITYQTWHQTSKML